jgi:hypothetical protein
VFNNIIPVFTRTTWPVIEHRNSWILSSNSNQVAENFGVSFYDDFTNLRSRQGTLGVKGDLTGRVAHLLALSSRSHEINSLYYHTEYMHYVLIRKKQKQACQGNLTEPMSDCWLVVSMHPEGPVTSNLDAGSLGFLLSLSKCWDGSQFPSWYCMHLIQPSRCKIIKMKLLALEVPKLIFQII